jgi:predicted RNA-binding Zn-ribbon protein involved in translation (DUF1610 family)
MTTVRTTCPFCGEVQLPAVEITLSWDLAEFRYRCPSCGDDIVKPADQRIFTMLLGAGTPVAKRRSLTPRFDPLTLDDILAFHEHIEEEIEELLR